MNEGQQRELGDFLRSRRERLRPEAFGMAPGRRRTPGLRRDEVAERAGISCEWYVRIEQGRAVAPSQATINALAKALLLDAAEHAHITGLIRAGAAGPFVRETVPERLNHFVGTLAQPAYIVGRRWDVLAWNAAASAIFDFGRLAADRRNILLFMMTDPAARQLFGRGWRMEAARMVALFRNDYAAWAGDPAFTSLLSQVGTGCPRFAAWWDAREVRRPTTGRKTLYRSGHVLAFDYATFQANDDPALKLVVYTPTRAATARSGVANSPRVRAGTTR